jgi:hypothetical protein
MFYVVRGLSRRVTLSRLLELEPDIRRYLAVILVDAVLRAGDTLIIPEGLTRREVTAG